MRSARVVALFFASTLYTLAHPADGFFWRWSGAGQAPPAPQPVSHPRSRESAPPPFSPTAWEWENDALARLPAGSFWQLSPAQSATQQTEPGSLLQGLADAPNAIPIPHSAWELDPLPRNSGDVELLPHLYLDRYKTVVFIELLKESLCSPLRDDWRGSLPRWVAGIVAPQGGEVVVWRPSYEMEDAVAKRNARPDTMHCYPEPVKGATERLFRMDDWLERKKVNEVDIVIVVGSSQPQAPACGRILNYARQGGKSRRTFHNSFCEKDPLWEMRYALSKLWIGKQTRLFQIPVSPDPEVNENKVARGIAAIIHDNDFVKLDRYDQPLWSTCSSYRRQKKLLYVGSHDARKGQLEFLRRVNPRLLNGYTIEFLSVASFAVEEMYKILAAKRGLKIKVHREVQKDAEYVKAFCTSVGAIMYSISDVNPRQAADVFRAGLPLLATYQTNLPAVVEEQTFVTLADSSVENFDPEMEGFLEETQHISFMSNTIARFIEQFESPDVAYHPVCQTLGLCQRDTQVTASSSP